MSVGWRLCIPFHKTLNETKQPFVRIERTESKTVCLPLYNTLTIESYYMCVFEDFKMEINISPNQLSSSKRESVLLLEILS